jgi:hypothetical protein
MRTILCGLVMLCCTVASMAQGQQVVIVPEVTDEILGNPGMGWQTFHCTSKQDLGIFKAMDQFAGVILSLTRK